MREGRRKGGKQDIGKKEDKNGYKYVGFIKWRVLSTTERNFSLRQIPIKHQCEATIENAV